MEHIPLPHLPLGTPYSGKFSYMVGLYHFAGLIDMHTHTFYALYNQAYFHGFNFTIRRSSAKTAKIGPLENFPLYSIYITDMDT